METKRKSFQTNSIGAVKFMALGTAAALVVSIAVNYLLLFSDAFDPFSRSMVAAVAVSVLVAAPLSLMLFLARSINERAKRELNRLATTDRITSFLNAPTFSTMVERRVRSTSGGAPAFVLVEIEHLRDLIMTYGQRYGEEAERLIAGTIRSSTRAGDLVGHTGEGRFGILLQNVTEAGTTAICRRIQDAISRVYFAPAGNQYRIDVRLAGISVDAPTNFSELLRTTGRQEECIVSPESPLTSLSQLERRAD
jgi:diguanylate cyclase (GGDEF)-like protein